MEPNYFDSLTDKFEKFMKFEEVSFTPDEMDRAILLWFRMLPEKAIFTLLHYDIVLESKVKYAISQLDLDQDLNFDQLVQITKEYTNFKQLFQLIIIDLTHKMVVNIYQPPIPETGTECQKGNDPFNPFKE